MRGQEGRSQDVGDGLGQERSAFQGTAYRVGPVLQQPVSQPADMRPEQGGPQEQRIGVQPDVAVIAGAQVEVSWLSARKLDDQGFHQVMVLRRLGSRNRSGGGGPGPAGPFAADRQ